MEHIIITFLALIFLLAFGVSIRKYMKKAKPKEQQTKNIAILKEFASQHAKTLQNPKDPQPWCEWGFTLLDKAREQRNMLQKRLYYNEACSCFCRASELCEHSSKYWTLWGAALYESFLEQKNADPFLLEGGHSKFRSSIQVATDTESAWRNWQKHLLELQKKVPREYKNSIQYLLEECQAALMGEEDEEAILDEELLENFIIVAKDSELEDGYSEEYSSFEKSLAHQDKPEDFLGASKSTEQVTKLDAKQDQGPERKSRIEELLQERIAQNPQTNKQTEQSFLSLINKGQ